MSTYVALHTIVVGRGADEKTLSAGEPLPSLPSAEVKRLLALGAIALPSAVAADGSPSASPVEYFTKSGERPRLGTGRAPVDPKTLPAED